MFVYSLLFLLLSISVYFIRDKYPLILLFIITGSIFLVSTSDLVSLFLSIELQSYGLYLPTHSHYIVLDIGFEVASIFKLLPIALTVYVTILSLILFVLLSIANKLNIQFFIEIFYNKYITGFIIKSGRQIIKFLDKGSLELLGPYGLEKGLINFSKKIASLDSGVVTSYALYILIGLISYILIPYIYLDNNSLLFLILFALFVIIFLYYNTYYLFNDLDEYYITKESGLNFNFLSAKKIKISFLNVFLLSVLGFTVRYLIQKYFNIDVLKLMDNSFFSFIFILFMNYTRDFIKGCLEEIFNPTIRLMQISRTWAANYGNYFVTNRLPLTGLPLSPNSDPVQLNHRGPAPLPANTLNHRGPGPLPANTLNSNSNGANRLPNSHFPSPPNPSPEELRREELRRRYPWPGTENTPPRELPLPSNPNPTQLNTNTQGRWPLPPNYNPPQLNTQGQSPLPYNSNPPQLNTQGPWPLPPNYRPEGLEGGYGPFVMVDGLFKINDPTGVADRGYIDPSTGKPYATSQPYCRNYSLTMKKIQENCPATPNRTQVWSEVTPFLDEKAKRFYNEFMKYNHPERTEGRYKNSDPVRDEFYDAD